MGSNAKAILSVFNLKLIPYNISGIETVVGKEEFITIKFIKNEKLLTK